MDLFKDRLIKKWTYSIGIMLFEAYRKISNALNGSGLSKIPLVRATHKKLIKSLASEIVKINGFQMYHLGSLDQENPEYIKVLQDNIKEGYTVLDIGANIGFYSLLMSRMVGDSGKVYAFEPEPRNFEILQKNIALNKITNVIVSNLALSDKVGKSFMELSSDSGQHRLSDSGVEIQTTTIDEYFKDTKIDFIKMDAEGSEGKILKGMSQRPPMVTEFYYKLLDHPVQFFSDLSDSYKLYDVRDGLKPVNKDAFFLKYNGATDLLCKHG